VSVFENLFGKTKSSLPQSNKDEPKSLTVQHDLDGLVSQLENDLQWVRRHSERLIAISKEVHPEKLQLEGGEIEEVNVLREDEVSAIGLAGAELANAAGSLEGTKSAIGRVIVAERSMTAHRYQEIKLDRWAKVHSFLLRVGTAFGVVFFSILAWNSASGLGLTLPPFLQQAPAAKLSGPHKAVPVSPVGSVVVQSLQNAASEPPK